MKGSSQHALHLYGEVMRRLSWFSRKIFACSGWECCSVWSCSCFSCLKAVLHMVHLYMGTIGVFSHVCFIWVGSVFGSWFIIMCRIICLMWWVVIVHGEFGQAYCHSFSVFLCCLWRSIWLVRPLR